jgi:hypothetical protein
MSEAVEILLSVDDQASAAVSNAAKKVASVDRDTSKATPKLISMEKAGRTAGDAIGRIGDVLDVPELNRAAGAFGSIAEQLEMAKESAGGLKLGFVGTAGVISGVAAGAFSIGKAIGDIVFQTAAWEEKLESALAISKQLEGRRSRASDRAFGDDLALMDLRGATDDEYLTKLRQVKIEAEGVSNSIRSELMKADKLRENSAIAYIYAAEIKAFEESAGLLQSQLEQLKEQEITLERILTVERDLSSERERKSRLDGEDRFIKQLKEELELLTASADEQDAILAARNAATIDGQAEIELLLRAKRSAQSDVEKLASTVDRVKASATSRTGRIGGPDRLTQLDGFESRLLTRGPAQESQETKALKDLLRETRELKKVQEKTSQDLSMLIRNPLVIGAPGGRR